jgi:sulfur relay (sulfurtransferase) DsrF/TusC family protein
MIDMVMVLATFECPVTVIIQDAGVLWTTLPTFPDGHPHSITGRLKSLPLYDVETVFISQNALDAFSIQPAPSFPGQAVDQAVIEAALSDADVILEA